MGLPRTLRIKAQLRTYSEELVKAWREDPEHICTRCLITELTIIGPKKTTVHHYPDV